MSCSHVCSVRDRRHRFPSLIDAFLSVHDRFHFRFDRFLDRFRFLKHDDDDDDLVSLFVLLLRDKTIGFSLSLFFFQSSSHTRKKRGSSFHKKKVVTIVSCFVRAFVLSLSLSLSLSMRMYGGREKRESVLNHTPLKSVSTN